MFVFAAVPVFGIFNVRTGVDARDCTRGIYEHHKSVCAAQGNGTRVSSAHELSCPRACGWSVLVGTHLLHGSLRPQKPYGLLGTEEEWNKENRAPGPPSVPTAPELCS